MDFWTTTLLVNVSYTHTSLLYVDSRNKHKFPNPVPRHKHSTGAWPSMHEKRFPYSLMDEVHEWEDSLWPWQQLCAAGEGHWEDMEMVLALHPHWYLDSCR